MIARVAFLAALLLATVVPAAHSEVVSLTDPVDQNNEPCLGGFCPYKPDVVSAAANLDPSTGSVEVRVRFAEPVSKTGFTTMPDFIDAALTSGASCNVPTSGPQVNADIRLSASLSDFPSQGSATVKNPYGLSVNGAAGSAPIDLSTRNGSTALVMKAANPVLVGRSFTCLQVTMTSWCESCNYYLGATVTYDTAAGTTPGSAEAFGDSPEGTPAATTAVTNGKIPTPRNVRYSGTKSITARFKPADGVKYTIAAAMKGMTVKGACRIRAGTATCTVRLPIAGRWRVSITPSRNDVKGKPASKTFVRR